MLQNDFTIASLGRDAFDSPVAATAFVADGTGVLLDATVLPGRQKGDTPIVLEAAGPRSKIYFDPATVRAGIVTCGGLCPGLNDVIRALTMVLWHRYGVRHILGLRYGYAGLVTGVAQPPLTLSPDLVEDIHKHGGTILGSSRGPQPSAAMVDFLVEHDINVLFTVGGDGTQRGALCIAQEIARRQLKIAVVGIPKTIDNDIAYTERTFGFETAVARSQDSITSAHMEAKAVRNGVGLVKLMGRESGFVAAYATLASSDVNLVLVPEVPFALDPVMAFLEERLQRKAHAVIVIAEGAGQELVTVPGADASGNRKLGDIGVFMKQAIAGHFGARATPMEVKYIDPSYLIRSAPANADDSVFCFRLAENAVHAAMLGRTAMVVALWNGAFVHVPMARAVATRKRIEESSALWQSVLDNTGQPADLT